MNTQRTRQEFLYDMLVREGLSITIGAPKPVERMCKEAMFSAKTIEVLQEAMVGLNALQIYQRVCRIIPRNYSRNELVKFLMKNLKPDEKMVCGLTKEYGIKLEIYPDNNYQAIYKFK